MNRNNLSLIIVALLILMAALSRFIDHPVNFTPIVAIILFSRVFFSDNFLKWLVPLSAILLSDIIIHITKGYGFGSFSYPVYGAYVLIFFLTFILLRKNKIQYIIISSLTASTLFFLITNFALFYPEAKEINMALGLYTHDFKGIVASYVSGLPFYRNMILGDLFFSGLLFGAYELTKRWIIVPNKA